MSAQPPSPENRWLSPGVLFGVLGMAGAIFSAYATLGSRITTVETNLESGVKRLDRIEDKLDRIISEGRHGE